MHDSFSFLVIQIYTFRIISHRDSAGCLFAASLEKSMKNILQ